MKVELSKDGCLTVKPDNGTEAFALKHWADGFFVEPPEERKTSMLVIAQADD